MVPTGTLIYCVAKINVITTLILSETDSLFYFNLFTKFVCEKLLGFVKLFETFENLLVCCLCN